VARYLFSSHDGYGLGHTRRNTLIAQALLNHDPYAEITVVSGISPKRWVFSVPGIKVVHVPPLIKDADGSFKSSQTTFEAAVAERQRVFKREI
jgi:predicted glycosyltransferase